MAQGKKPFFTFNDLKQAAIKGGFDKAQDFGKQIYDIGADALGGVFDIADRNRIDRLKNDKTQQKEVQKLQANIQKRKAEDVQRNKDLAEINLENQGKSTRLESKDRIVKKLASNEVKAVKQVKNDLTKNVDQAINERVAVLRAAGEPEDKIQSWVAMQKSGAGNQIKNITSMESQASSKAVNDLARGGGVNPFAIDRANQEFEQLQGKEVDTKRAIRTSVPVETLARTIKPIVDMGNDIELLATTGIDKVLGTNLTKASLANVEAQKAKGAQVGGVNYADALDVDQSLGAQAQRFVGQSVPFVLAPETAVARRAGATAARMLRPGLLRNVVKAGITEGVQDTPLSTLQTVAELNRRVQTGEITGQEAMQQLPVAIGGNLVGDIGGAGLLRGAGDLASKALKGAPDLVNPTRNNRGAITLEAPKAEAPKVLTPEDIKKAQYQKSFSRLNELAPKQKELTQAITKAQIEGDYGRVAQLKQEAKAVKEEAKYLKQTVNNLELEGLQKAQEVPKPQEVATNEAVQVNQDVENIRKILGNNQEGILPQQQPKLRQETTPVISGGRVSELVSPSQNNLNALPTSNKGQLGKAQLPELKQELKAQDNLTNKAQDSNLIENPQTQKPVIQENRPSEIKKNSEFADIADKDLQKLREAGQNAYKNTLAEQRKLLSEPSLGLSKQQLREKENKLSMLNNAIDRNMNYVARVDEELQLRKAPTSKQSSAVQTPPIKESLPGRVVIKDVKDLETLTDADKIKAQRKFAEEVNQWEKIEDPRQKQARRAELLKKYPPEIWKQLGKEVESIRRKVKSSVTQSRLIIHDGEVVGRMRPNYISNGNLKNIDSWSIENIDGDIITTLKKEKKYIETSDLKDLLIADADKFPKSGIAYDPGTKKYVKDGRSTTRGELSHFETLGFLKKTDPTIRDSQTGKADETADLKIENFTEVKVLNNEWQKLKEKHGEKKGKAIYDAALRLVNPNKNEIIEIRGNGVVVKENDKYLLKPFGNTDASSKKWTLYRDLDVTDQFKENIIQETKPSQIKDIQIPRNQAELEQTYKETFKLDEPKAKAAAVVTDRIFDTIARRKGITKEAAYAEVGFKKSNLNEVGKGAKFQSAQTEFKDIDVPALKTMKGKEIGRGERSIVYEIKGHPDKVLKVSKDPSERKSLKFAYDNPQDFYVKVFDLKKEGNTVYAVLEKVDGETVSFKHNDGSGKYFYESKFRKFSGKDKSQREWIKQQLENPSELDQYWDFLDNAEKAGFDYWDAAWNTGRRSDGSFVMFDGEVSPELLKKIKFQSEKGAMETLESGKKVIHALTDPNVSTPLHEIAHVYEEVLTKSERNTILDWAGSKEWDTNASEKFARGFERYLAEGKAPIPALKEIFEDFKDWLVDIYKGITGSEIDLKLNKQMRKIYDDMIALDPKLSESLSAKVLNEKQDLKGVRRVIYEPKAFQEAQRNPKNLSTLTEAYGDKVPKNSEKIMSEASKVKKELNDVEASLKDNKAQLAKIMRDAKVDSIEVEIDGKKYTIKRPTKPDDKVVFNNQGRLAREELVNQFQKEGKISFDGDQGINLAIQSEAKAASRATKYGTKNLEEAAKEHVKFLREAAVLAEKEGILKEKIIKDIAPKLENGGLDHVWRNSEADTSFAIKRNPAKSNFKNADAEAEFKVKEAELKANVDNVKIQKGEYGSTGLSEAQALGINRRTKTGKAEYAEFQSKVRRDIEAKTALEDGIETPKQADAVIESGLEQYRKLDENKGKQFAFNPVMAAALLNSDSVLIGARLFKPLIDKALSKQGALVNNVYDGLKTVVGRSESYATRLRDSKIPAFRKLIDDYDNLAAREYQAEGYMRTKFSPEQVEKIGAAIKEHGFRDLEDMMKGGQKIEGIESTDEMEILKAFMQNRRKRADLIKDSIEQGKKANIAKGDLALLESFYANETKTNKGTGAALQGLATDLLYFKALWNNLKSTTLVATDPLTKLVPEFGIGKTALSLKDVMDSKVRNSPLFKAYNAGASGTFVDALTARKAEGLGKVWEKIKKTSIFSAVTEASQDMGLLAHARSFNDYWKKKTGESINILDDFDGMNEASQEFALMHNALTNKLYGAGKGTIYQAEIEGNNFIKPFMAFMGEPIRFQKRMSEWRSIMAKANEPGATTLDKEMAKRARNGMITFVAMTALLGGSTALKNMGGAIGSSYNLALNLMTPEERQRTEDWINAFQLTRYLNIDLGEKLGVSLLQRGEKESFLDSIKKSLSGDSGIAVVQALVQYPKDFEKMQNYFKAGNKEQAYFTMAKMLMGSAPGTVDKILKKLNQEPISVWIEENGNMKEEFKAVDLADILSYSANETDIKKAVKMETKAKEAAVGKVEKIGKRYKLASNSKEFNEYLDLLSSERFKLNPVANRQELEQKLLKAAFAKQTNQSKQLAKFAPKTSVAYLKSQSEEDLIKRIAASSGEKRQEAVQALHQLKAQSKKQERRKFVNVLAELEESA